MLWHFDRWFTLQHAKTTNNMSLPTPSERKDEETPLGTHPCEEVGCPRQFDSLRGLAVHAAKKHPRERARRFGQVLLDTKKTSEAAHPLDSMDDYAHTTSHLASDEELLAPDMDVMVEELWAECGAREQFVEDFLTNYNEPKSAAVSRPVRLMMRASAVSYDQFAPVYGTLMATVCSLETGRDAFLEALPRELRYHSLPSNVWDHCVLLFTWAGTILWRWPGSYPKLADMLSRYLRLAEEDLVKAGGWNGVSQQQQSRFV